MDVQIATLQSSQVSAFWPVFEEVLRLDFPGYTEKVLNYFLTRIYTRISFSYWVENKTKTVLVATDGLNITGFAVIDEPYGGVSFCRWLGVKREHQKKGIGSKLIQAWLDLARSQKCHKAEVASQPEAKAFYEKAGLTYEGERKLSYFGIDQFMFGKVFGAADERAMVGEVVK